MHRARRFVLESQPMTSAARPRRHLPRCKAALLVALVLQGCATQVENQPLNVPITPAFVAQAAQPRGVVDRNVVALSLSGGGMRAAAFGLGVIQALAGSSADGPDIYDDLSFISSVSGGSLTAAYVALHGRAALARMRNEVLVRDLERDLRLSIFSPANLLRLASGGLNDRSGLARLLDTEVFAGATFADLYRRNKPDVWINATDLYNRTPFPFTPPAFMALCSDLSSLPVSEAVAASMAVPLVFAPLVLKTFPEHCLTPLAPRVAALGDASTQVATDPLAATARAIRHYRDPGRMRYLKLADGGLTDNQGLASILLARALSGTPHGPLTEVDAVRIRRMLFLIVDAGRPPAGDWALRPDGPSGLDVGIAAADAAIDSATRLSADAFRAMVQDWREQIVRFRCALGEARARPHLETGEPWRCDDVMFFVGTVSAESLEPERAARMRAMPTRLALAPSDIDAAISAGRDATLRDPALRRYLAARVAPRSASAAP
jgi:NTE family protein